LNNINYDNLICTVPYGYKFRDAVVVATYVVLLGMQDNAVPHDDLVCVCTVVSVVLPWRQRGTVAVVWSVWSWLPHLLHQGLSLSFTTHLMWSESKPNVHVRSKSAAKWWPGLVVTLRQARLILGWVTICWQVNHLGIINHLGQLSLSSFWGR